MQLKVGEASRALLLAAVACGSIARADTRASSPADAVNVFIGTTNAGNEYPGATMPFGMVAFSPEETPLPGRHYPDASPSGYEWHATGIKGFSLTHLMGAGCEGANGDIPFMPVTVPVDMSPELPIAQMPYASGFSHDREVASPGAYSVTLDNGVKVDLGATRRAGVATFTFPADQPANLLIHPSASEVGSSDAHIVIDAAHHRVSGDVTSGNFCGQSDPHRVSYYTLHFVAEFDRPFTVGGTWENDRLHPGATAASGGTGYGERDFPPIGKGSGGWIGFDPAAGPVTARIGISYVDDAGARANLKAEAPSGTTLAEVRRRAHDAWNEQLGRIAITGGTTDERTVFYTALYHALIHPSLYSDVDGRYRGFDKAVHRVSRFQQAQYANFSGWDVYRSQVQLVTLIDPQVGSDFAQSLLNQADQNGGVWDRWTHITGATSVMNGDPSPPTLAAIRAFGGRDFDLQSAYASLLKAATQPTALDLMRNVPITGFGERPGLDLWLKHHYMPVGSPLWGSAASTLEYAAADFGVAELARQAGDTANARLFRERAGWWRNLFNPEATSHGGYIQPRNGDGSWPAFDPASGDGFVEGSGAQYLWMVPFDAAGLIDKLGGKQAANERLDAFFKGADGTWAVTKAGPLHPELDNEPSIAAPWLYNFVGQPWKTQAVVRAAMKQIWTNAPDGISGNDDLGEMSSWYVWSALGLYPLYPGRAELVVGSPLFPQAVIRRPDATITIRGVGAAMDAPYVRSLDYDGKPWSRSWLPASFIARGGALDFQLGSAPDRDWAASPADIPPSFGPGSPVK